MLSGFIKISTGLIDSATETPDHIFWLYDTDQWASISAFLTGLITRNK
jgi:hypothetical protein